MHNTTTVGCESLKEILNIGTNAAKKLVEQNLIAIQDGNVSERNQKYALWDIERLRIARNRPFLIPEGEIALVCSLGEARPHLNIPPSIFWDAEGSMWHTDLDEAKKAVPSDTVTKLNNGELRLIGYWRVSEQDTQKLIDDEGIVVASYAGFILDGGRVCGVVPKTNKDPVGRRFLVKPFTMKERFRYAHNYLPSRQGPPNKVWTSEELVEEAKSDSELVLPVR